LKKNLDKELLVIIMIFMEAKSEIKELITKFKEFILERDLTLQQIAVWLKMSHSAVADILNEKTLKPHPRTLYKIRKLIGDQ